MKKPIAFIILFGILQVSMGQAPPQLIVELPLSWSTATPLLHIKAKCIDSAGCSLSVTGGLPGILGVGINFAPINVGDSVDSTIDLSADQGVSGNIYFTATDPHGQSTQLYKQIFVDSSSRLEQVFAATDQILDLNDGQVFVTNPWWQGYPPASPDLNPYISRSRIVNINTGDSISVPYQGPLYISDGADPGQDHFLTPYGAIFGAADTTDNLYNILAWDNDSLYRLGPLNGTYSLHTAGNYALWSNDTLLDLIDLRTANVATISSSAQNIYNDVDSNGVVTFGGTDFNIYRFANNSITQVTNGADGKWNTYPLTDGSSIVYVKGDPCCTNQHYALHVYDGHSDSLLSDEGTYSPTPMVDYQINNKYIAYTQPDPSGISQVWLRDTLGNHTQLSFFGTNSRIDRLNSNGDLTFVTSTSATTGRRYFASKANGQVIAISSALGRTYCSDSGWYVVLGRMVYKIDLSDILQRPAAPVIDGLDSSYCSNSGVHRIKVLNLPSTNSGDSVLVQLDSIPLPVAQDSTVSFDVTNMALGRHVVEIQYSNAFGTSTLTDPFNIVPAVTPSVKLSSNLSTVINFSEPVIITATDLGGGGSNPDYTFAKDRNFSTVLQSESTDNTLDLLPETLDVGVNWIFVRMTTSDTCYTGQTATDSIQVVRNAVNGLIDPDYPNSPILVYPNPFSNAILLTGLSSAKMYEITIYNASSQVVDRQRLAGAVTITLNEASLAGGDYWIDIYDATRNRRIGSINIIKK